MSLILPTYKSLFVTSKFVVGFLPYHDSLYTKLCWLFQNEETLKKAVADYQQKLKKQEEKYQMLKKCAEEKLEKANEEVEKTRKTSETEVMRLKAALKKAEIDMASLEQQVEQKVRSLLWNQLLSLSLSC